MCGGMSRLDAMICCLTAHRGVFLEVGRHQLVWKLTQWNEQQQQHSKTPNWSGKTSHLKLGTCPPDPALRATVKVSHTKKMQTGKRGGGAPNTFIPCCTFESIHINPKTKCLNNPKKNKKLPLGARQMLSANKKPATFALLFFSPFKRLEIG